MLPSQSSSNDILCCRDVRRSQLCEFCGKGRELEIDAPRRCVSNDCLGRNPKSCCATFDKPSQQRRSQLNQVNGPSLTDSFSKVKWNAFDIERDGTYSNGRVSSGEVFAFRLILWEVKSATPFQVRRELLTLLLWFCPLGQ